MKNDMIPDCPEIPKRPRGQYVFVEIGPTDIIIIKTVDMVETETKLWIESHSIKATNSGMIYYKAN